MLLPDEDRPTESVFWKTLITHSALSAGTNKTLAYLFKWNGFCQCVTLFMDKLTLLLIVPIWLSEVSEGKSFIQTGEVHPLSPPLRANKLNITAAVTCGWRTPAGPERTFGLKHCEIVLDAFQVSQPQSRQPPRAAPHFSKTSHFR